MKMDLDAQGLALAVKAKGEDLQARLLAKVEANLSGDVLQTRTGALKASVLSSLDADTGSVKAILTSAGVAYAAIQEYGGQTSPHEIVPVKAQALMLAGAAGPAFARRVRHPGSRIPARPYLGSALDELHPQILAGLKDSVLAALGAG